MKAKTVAVRIVALALGDVILGMAFFCVIGCFSLGFDFTVASLITVNATVIYGVGACMIFAVVGWGAGLASLYLALRAMRLPLTVWREA